DSGSPRTQAAPAAAPAPRRREADQRALRGTQEALPLGWYAWGDESRPRARRPLHSPAWPSLALARAGHARHHRRPAVDRRRARRPPIRNAADPRRARREPGRRRPQEDLPLAPRPPRPRGATAPPGRPEPPRGAWGPLEAPISDDEHALAGRLRVEELVGVL